MFVKKVTSDQRPSSDKRPSDPPIAVLLEPLPGRTDQDVMDHLAAESASDVEVLSPGFISAQLAPASFRAMEAVAAIHPKPRKQSR